MPVERFEPSRSFSLIPGGFTAGFTLCAALSCSALTGKLTGSAHLSLKGFIDLVHCLLLHRWQDMRVDIHRNIDLAMS